MTEIAIQKDADATNITISGHSMSKRVNNIDLCCCSVSTLVFTLWKSLSELNLKNFHYILSKGFCTISFDNPHEDLCKKAFIIIDTVINGFYLLRQTYPQNIVITKKGVNCI